MAINYIWTFSPLEYEDVSSYTQVVKVVHWQVSGSDGTHDGRAIGTFACADPEGDFIAYDDLTAEIVKSWIDPDTIAIAENAVAVKINSQSDDAAVNKGSGVPW